MFDLRGMNDFSTLLRPQSAGKPLNSHVVESIVEPKPDFAAMKRTIQGAPGAPEKHEGSHDDQLHSRN